MPDEVVERMTDWTYIEDMPGRGRGSPSGPRPAGPTDPAHADESTAPRSTETVWELGSVVAGRYVLHAHLGRGRYGEIYKALDRSLSDAQMGQEHWVALHLLHDRIAAQTRVLQRLEAAYHQPHMWSHPNVVRISGFGSDRGKYFLVTELLDGASLRFILDDASPELLPEAETLAVLRSVGDALKYAHAKGAVHSDIRPEKIFITTEYGIKVVDLLPASAARAAPFFVEDASRDGPATPDPRDDVYGLACVAYELLSGRHPFNANSPLEALNAGLSAPPIAGLTRARWDALARGLALRREHRTASVATFLAELGIKGHERLRPSPESTSTQPRPPPPVDAQRARDDDTPIVGDYSPPPSARAAAPPPASIPVREPPTEPMTRAPERPRNMSEFMAYADLALHRDRREPRRFGLPIVPLFVIAVLVVLGVAVYVNYKPLLGNAGQMLAGRDSAARRGGVELAAPSSTEQQPTAGEAAQQPSPAEPAPSGDAPVTDGAAPREGASAAGPAPATGEAYGRDAAPREAAAGEATAAPADTPAEPAPRVGTERVEAPAVAAVPPAVKPPAAAPSAGPARFEFGTRGVTVPEAQATATIVIRRQGGMASAASVTWWTSDGSAVADDDYASLGAKIERFAPGEEARTIYIPIVVDSKIESRESFYVNMRDSEQTPRQSDPAQRVEVVIVDDDF